MGMVVRTNTMSANAYRQLGMNNTQLSKSLEKLSSGFRINRAGDDAAGLAISEKMKAQIKGLEQASANSQDGISLVQTAEGALTEVHSMLNRMVELATKSANGTIQNEVDREAIQTETDALKDEITRISKSTNFNGITLLDGSIGANKSVVVSAATVGGHAAQITSVPAATSTYTSQAAVVASTSKVSYDLTVTYTDANGKEQSAKVSYAGDNDATNGNKNTADAMAQAINENATLGSLFTASVDSSKNLIVTSKATGKSASTVKNIVSSDTAQQDKVNGGTSTAGENAYNTIDLGSLAEYDTLTINGKTYEFVATGHEAKTTGSTVITFDTGIANTSTALISTLRTDGILAADTNGATSGDVYSFKADPSAKGKGLVLQVGDTNDEHNKVNVQVGDMSAAGLGIEDLKVNTQETAGAAIKTIQAAINTVSTNRGKLGALQNRLEHAISNLDTTAENMDAANSAIRDTDMAKEMMNYTKMNILSQAAQAMLAQANQQPQNILQLLK